MASSDENAGSPPTSDKMDLSPLVHNTVRAFLSAKEYRAIHDIAIRRTPSLGKRLPDSLRDDSITYVGNSRNMRALRASMRVFAGGGVLLKLVEVIIARIQDRVSSGRKAGASRIYSSALRLSISTSLLLLFHRLIYQFLSQLRLNLRVKDAQPFRERNPTIARALTSRYAPVIGSSLAGLTLQICPPEHRLAAAIYWTSRSMETVFNDLESKGYFPEEHPWWFGSWLLMPASCAQLFHAFVFDRETTPQWFSKVVIAISPTYFPGRPDSSSYSRPWPTSEEVVDSIASTADMGWPAFVCPLLYPQNPKAIQLPETTTSLITGSAHPAITNLSCALLHPYQTSCNMAFIQNVLTSAPYISRWFTMISLALGIINIKKRPTPFRNISSGCWDILKMTAMLSFAGSSLWGSMCLMNTTLHRSILPNKRVFISGAIGGLPFFFLSKSRGVYLYFLRLAMDSAWKVGVKRGVWKGIWGGSSWLLVISWAVIGYILESNPSAVQGERLRKALAWMKGEGFVDPVEIEKRKARRGRTLQKAEEKAEK
ncbi:hypothetical protein N7495_000196 [Penicillium taxi]|uniref:uncharacterized protein n=1 Tax=Penicillium taxi TaxID=168475 RepID=UPI0025457AF6|nr:uncharacterized protein N7495_000196 [Penicillium taxi]KAJ5907514.1 hypothetical protein N7495_000196 [Penicillium taxi]